MGKESQLCIYREFCGKGVALEHDGSLYSCDHYVYPEYKLGNIMQTSSSRMVFSARPKEFGFNKFNSSCTAVSRVQLPVRLPWGVCEKPADPHARGRSRPELSVQRAAEVLAPYRSRCTGHLPPYGARGIPQAGLTRNRPDDLAHI